MKELYQTIRLVFKRGDNAFEGVGVFKAFLSEDMVKEGLYLTDVHVGEWKELPPNCYFGELDVDEGGE